MRISQVAGLLSSEAEVPRGTVLDLNPAVHADRLARPVAQAEMAIKRTQVGSAPSKAGRPEHGSLEFAVFHVCNARMHRHRERWNMDANVLLVDQRLYVGQSKRGSRRWCAFPAQKLAGQLRARLKTRCIVF